MAVLTIKGKTTNDSVAIKNPTGDKTYFTAGETSATLGTGVTIGSGVTNNSGVASGTIGSGVVFPAGMMRFVSQTRIGDSTGTPYTRSSAVQLFNVALTGITVGSKILLQYIENWKDEDAGNNYGSHFFTGSTDSGLGATTSGYAFSTGLGYAHTQEERETVAGSYVATTTISNPTYGVYWGSLTGSPSDGIYDASFTIIEIYQ
jgi:hypothetical protein